VTLARSLSLNKTSSAALRSITLCKARAASRVGVTRQDVLLCSVLYALRSDALIIQTSEHPDRDAGHG
jgi:hypothetical protein